MPSSTTPHDVAMLAAIRSQTLALIAEITSAPKPSYTLDGQRVAWAEYLRQLQSTVEWCERRLASEQPFEIHSTGYTP